MKEKVIRFFRETSILFLCAVFFCIVLGILVVVEASTSALLFVSVLAIVSAILRLRE